MNQISDSSKHKNEAEPSSVTAQTDLTNQHHDGSGDNVGRDKIENRHTNVNAERYIERIEGNYIVNQQITINQVGETTTKSQESKADVLIIAALKEEFDALMAVTGGEELWEAKKEDNFTKYYVRDFASEKGFPFRVAAMWANGMGATRAAILATHLTNELKPQCLAMCGICAGREGDVFLGDVIVADRVFRYDEGKIKQGQFQHEITTFNLKPKWKTAVEEVMSQWKPSFVNERSLSLDYQANWLLRGIAELEAGEISKLQDYAPLNEYVLNRQAALKRLKQKKWIELKGFKLTNEGREFYENEQFIFPDEPEADPDFRVHLGTVGTGTKVIEDEKIFEDIAKVQRKIIGLEMEGEAIGIVSEIKEIEYHIFVKGVCDYADQYKDDSFREFAAKASASFLIDFLKKYLPQKKSLSHRYINQAPPLPSNFVSRPEASEQLKKDLLSKETEQAGILVVSAIYGLGGIGKSVLATALAYDKEVQTHFSDGIFWATLGQQPNILSFLSAWIQALGDYNFKPISVEAASLQLRTLLADKKVLLVVDDLWNPNDFEPFRVVGEGCRILVTTREAPVLGANRYDLNLMTEEQSVALLTSCVKQELTQEEKEKAEELAKKVGYLPLALELAAAQVSEGLTWDDLLSGLEAELEILDRWEADEYISEAERRNYSLVASFNLSLKRLSSERLKQFAWLGVLPDDVTITEKMATTLWDCSLIQAKKTLIYFRNKALLMSGGSSEEGILSYRLHDLLHDLARNLLSASPQPQEDSQLPGLGLSILQAHQQLLERYQKKTQKGLWHTLEDDGYIYSQLIWHLEKAEKIEEIHKLLREETPEGLNGWYSQCEKEGKTANFVKDVSKAWQIAKAHFEKNPSKSLNLQCRYALIKASIKSRSDIPSDLLIALVEYEIWHPKKGLTYALQMPKSSQKIETLQGLYNLSPNFKEICPDIITKIERELYKLKQNSSNFMGASKICTLAFLRGVKPLGLSLCWLMFLQKRDAPNFIQEDCTNVGSPSALTAAEWNTLLTYSLKKRKKGAKTKKIDELIQIIPTLSNPSEILDTVLAIKQDRYRGRILTCLACYLPLEKIDKVLESVSKIYDKDRRVKYLSRLIRLRPDLPHELKLNILQEQLSFALLIEKDKWHIIKAQIQYISQISVVENIILSQKTRELLHNEIDYLLENEWEFFLNNIQDLVKLMKSIYLIFTDFQNEIFKKIIKIGNHELKSELLTVTFPYFNDLLQEKIFRLLVKPDRPHQASFFIDNILHLVHNNFLHDKVEEIFNLTLSITNLHSQVSILKKLEVHLPNDLRLHTSQLKENILQKAFNKTLKFQKDELTQISELIWIASHRLGLWMIAIDKALEIILELQDNRIKVEQLVNLLIKFPDYLEPDVHKQLFKEISELQDELARINELTRIAGSSSKSLRNLAQNSIQKTFNKMSDQVSKANVLIILLQHSSKTLQKEAFQQAQNIIPKIQDSHIKTNLLIEMAHQVSGQERYDTWKEILNEALMINDDLIRINRLSRLVKQLELSDHESVCLFLKTNIDTIFPIKETFSDMPFIIDRKMLLTNISTFAPILRIFGGVELIADILISIKLVSRWWP